MSASGMRLSTSPQLVPSFPLLVLPAWGPSHHSAPGQARTIGRLPGQVTRLSTGSETWNQGAASSNSWTKPWRSSVQRGWKFQSSGLGDVRGLEPRTSPPCLVLFTPLPSPGSPAWIMQMRGVGWRKCSLLSLSGILIWAFPKQTLGRKGCGKQGLKEGLGDKIFRKRWATLGSGAS